MAGFPNAVHDGIASEADAGTQRPHADEAIEVSAGCGQPGSHHVRVIKHANGRVSK